MGDIFVSASGCLHVITGEHMQRMKNNAIVCNIGHFDIEIDVAYLENTPGIEEENIKPLVDRFTFPDGHAIILLSRGRLVNLGNATGHPSFVMSTSFTNQVLAQMMLWQEQLEKKLHLMPKALDEEVARLHLDKLGIKLTRLTPEQAKYLDMNPDGPYKPEGYRY